VASTESKYRDCFAAAVNLFSTISNDIRAAVTLDGNEFVTLAETY